jgi:hypothetical protein
MTVMGSGHGGKAKEETLCWAGGVASHVGKRAKRERRAEGFVKPLQLVVT